MSVIQIKKVSDGLVDASGQPLSQSGSGQIRIIKEEYDDGSGKEPGRIPITKEAKCASEYPLVFDGTVEMGASLEIDWNDDNYRETEKFQLKYTFQIRPDGKLYIYSDRIIFPTGLDASGFTYFRSIKGWTRLNVETDGCSKASFTWYVNDPFTPISVPMPINLTYTNSSIKQEGGIAYGDGGFNPVKDGYGNLRVKGYVHFLPVDLHDQSGPTSEAINLNRDPWAV
jgi:hypothetical protein